MPGLLDGDGRHYLLDNGTVRILSPDFQDEAKLSEPVHTLFQGSKGWGSSFLALSDQGLARVSTKTAEPQFNIVIPGENLSLEPWGESFLAHTPKGVEVTVVSSEGETSLPLGGALEFLHVVDPSLVLLRTDQELLALRQAAAQKPSLERVALPFPLQEARVGIGQAHAYAWSPSSPKVIDLIGKSQPLTLPGVPKLGLRVLLDGSLVAAGESSLMVKAPGLNVSEFPRPRGITEAAFAGWSMVVNDGNLILFTQENGRYRSIFYRNKGGVPSDLLPKGELRSIVMPEEGSSGRPLLFLETQKEEPKLDKKGRAVLDLDTGEPVMMTILGHHIYSLDAQGRWIPVVQEARAALVGPIQRVGDRVLYATQTEPERQPGVKLEVDPKYPYPAVVLQGRLLSNPEDVWAFEKPRGETPSKSRLPETAWPFLSEKGPLLLTSEGDRLLAIDPADGALAWSSEKLTMDESSPTMLLWKDSLGLLTAKSTGRALVVIDPEQGEIRQSLTLNEIFFRERWRHLLGVLIVCSALAYYIYAAGKRNLYIRRIAGLQALDEAVGRATEMGKPVLYVVGLADVDDIQTMASLSILSHVARKTAEYDTPIVATTSRAVAFSAAQEIVRDAFSVAGHPDAFSVESVRYISDDQFGYTAGVDGIMVREKPAANFYIGKFYAESLILAETGHATGSIQIAGTAEPSQVPFFVAACDYTLIGEELFAASAYLSRDPLQVGSLRGQDVGKAIIMVLLILCSVLVSLGIDWSTISEWTEMSLP